MPNNTNNTSELYQVVHSSPELKTVGDYISQLDSPAFEYSKKNPKTQKDGSDDFLAVKGPDGKTNRERIESNFFTSEDKKTAGKPAAQLNIKTGTILYIPVEKVNRIGLLTEGIKVVSSNTQAFIADALLNLLLDKGYQSLQKPIKGKIQKGSLKKQFPDISVWVWCRALSTPTSDNELKGQIFNITPFVEDISTNTGKNGGNFQIKLPPLTCEFIPDDNGGGAWSVKKQVLSSFKSKNSNKRDYLAKDFLTQRDRDNPVETYIRNDFLFHTIMQGNDLVFIRFETLINEAEKRAQDINDLDFIIDNINLPGSIFDMIGLIDTDGITLQAAANDVNIHIQGRDLSKLFIDDGCYFYPLEFSQGKLNFAGGSTNKNALMQRVFSDNALNYLGLYLNQSIEHVIKFVMQQLSTIKVVPNDLFYYYPNRNTRFDPDNDSKDKMKNLDLQNESAKQKAREAIEVTRTRNGYQEDSDQKEKARVEDVLSEMIRFRKAVLTKKVNTTTGWRNFIWTNDKGIPEDIAANVYPVYFSKQLYKTTAYIPDDISTSVMQSIQIDKSRSDFTHQEKYQQQLAAGIWQIIYLVIDESVTNRRIVDSSMSSANGSLLNFIHKVCQEPFVEFFMDTYGDAFYLIIRKPPFDETAIQSIMNGQVKSTDIEVNDKLKAYTLDDILVIDIEDSDVIGDNLDYDSDSAVSWYHFTPQGSFFGDSNNYSLAYMPAIFFPEYAEIWGSKPMQLVNNYTPYFFLDKKDSNALSLAEKQAFEDLKYMIDTNSYLPFTRKGTITINGDRRIKRGMFINYKPTNEVFYVDGVNQKYKIGEADIDRTTTLQVSRGMVRKYMFPQTIPGIKNKVSYFNIINTELNYQNKTTLKRNTTTQDTPLKDDSKTNDRQYVTEMSGLATSKGFVVTSTTGGTHHRDSKHYLGQAIDVSVVGKSTTDIIGFMDFMRSKGYKVIDERAPQPAPWSGPHIHIEVTNAHTNPPDQTTQTDVVSEEFVTDINRDSIFNNFRVNVDVFNFFLKRQQLSK